MSTIPTPTNDSNPQAAGEHRVHQQGSQDPYATQAASNPAPSHATNPAQAEATGFVKALFDFKFESFVTLKFTKIIYLMLIVMTALTLVSGWLIPAFGLMFNAGSFGIFAGIAWLLIGWVIPIIMLVLYRVAIEFIVATIRTAQNTTAIRQSLTK